MLTHPLEPKSVTVETKKQFEKLMKQGLVIQSSCYAVMEKLAVKIANLTPQDPQQVQLLDSWIKQKQAAEFCFNKIEECKIAVAMVLFTDFKLISPEDLTSLSQVLNGFLQASKFDLQSPDESIKKWASQRLNYFQELKALFDRSLVDKINRQLREQEKYWN